jgi:tRNA pseudouridine38-40 synthase
MKNFKIAIEYDGSRYKGWQRLQDNENIIQGKIENVLTKMCGHNVEIIGCRRTDAGVHAENYTANFYTDSMLSEGMMLNYLYEFLPEDIVVKDIKEIDERFHSRYNAKAKTYVYTLPVLFPPLLYMKVLYFLKHCLIYPWKLLPLSNRINR